MYYVPKSSGALAVGELEGVAWAALRHAYGRGETHVAAIHPLTRERAVIVEPAVDAILRAIGRGEAVAMPDEIEGRRALEVLPMRGLGPVERALCHYTNVLWHQGTLHEATAATVPFLAAFAADPAHVVRSELLELLVVLLVSAAEQPRRPFAREVRAAIALSREWFLQGAGAGDARLRIASRWLADHAGAEWSDGLSADADALLDMIRRERHMGVAHAEKVAPDAEDLWQIEPPAS